MSEADGDIGQMVVALNEQINLMKDLLETHEKKFASMEARIASLESSGGGGSSGASSSSKSSARSHKSPAKGKSAHKAGKSSKAPAKVKASPRKKRAAASGVDKSRLVTYDFGTGRVNVLRPTSGVPTEEEAAETPAARLELDFAHGYWGAAKTARQNMYLSADNQFLIYHIAAIGVVMNVSDNSQRHFFSHNDDITAICIDPREGSTLVATGQKDPKDEPGQGKDLPKIWIWDYSTMEEVQLIDKICWGSVSKVAWSGASGNLFCLCGDDDQTLKVYDSSYFGTKKKPPRQKKKGGRKKGKDDEQTNFEPMFEGSTSREPIFGMTLHPSPPETSSDECIFFGKRKFLYSKFTGESPEMKMETKQVSIGKFSKEGEAAFTCAVFLPNGMYCVGAGSGNIYLCKDWSVVGVMAGAHAKAVGDMFYDEKEGHLVTGGNDRQYKRWTVLEGKKKKCLSLVKENKIHVPDSDCHFQPKAMAYDAESGVMYAGTRTNQICKYDEKEDVASIVVDGHDGQIWGLATHPSEDIFVTGGYDNAIKVFDAKTRKCTWTYEFEKKKGKKGSKGYEVNSCAWSNDGNVIVIGTEDSNLGIFKYIGPTELEFQGMVNIPPKRSGAEIEAVSYLRFSEDSSLLAVAHMDSNLYIFGVSQKDGKVALSQWKKPMPSRAAPVNCQFSSDASFVKVFTRDYEIAHYKLDLKKKRGSFDPSIPDPDKVTWADDPLIAGWDTQGCFQDGWDGTDLNDCTITADRKFIVSGDDYGNTFLGNYPCINPSSMLRYSGHAEFVVGVECLRSSDQVITCGGSDKAIFQWKLVREDGSGDDDDYKEE